MIEPTESESREELDLFVDAMRQIAREVEENIAALRTPIPDEVWHEVEARIQSGAGQAPAP